MTPAEFNEFKKLKDERISLLERSVALSERGDKEARQVKLSIYRRLVVVKVRLNELSSNNIY